MGIIRFIESFRELRFIDSYGIFWELVGVIRFIECYWEARFIGSYGIFWEL